MHSLTSEEQLAENLEAAVPQKRSKTPRNTPKRSKPTITVPAVPVTPWNKQATVVSMPCCSMDWQRKHRVFLTAEPLPPRVAEPLIGPAWMIAVGLKAVKSGVSNYVIKPFTADILKEKLEAVHKKISAA
jgi:hypothetical protein